MTDMPLREYIEKHFSTAAEFAQACGVVPQQVNKWLAMKCIVVDGVLYSPRRDVPAGTIKVTLPKANAK